MSAQEVQQASDRFYEALGKLLNGDPSEMEQVWDHGTNVSTLHPIGGMQSGWDEVWAGWQGASRLMTNGRAEVDDLHVYVLGDVAYTIGNEHVAGMIGATSAAFDARTTNIYRREAGDWKMVHHHSDTDQETETTVQALMAQHG